MINSKGQTIEIKSCYDARGRSVCAVWVDGEVVFKGVLGGTSSDYAQCEEFAVRFYGWRRAA